MIPSNLKATLETQLQEKIVKMNSVSGGCIAESFHLQTESKHSYFLKYSPMATDLFEKEAHGLEAIEKSKTLPVPKIFSYGKDYLVLEYLTPSSKTEDFWKIFGQQFAKMHLTSPSLPFDSRRSEGATRGGKGRGSFFGFKEDNFIGLTPQKNTPMKTTWDEFYWEYRLLAQLKLAERNGHATSEMNQLFQKLEKKLPHILKGSEEPPSLLHGDLWSGNYLCGPGGKPYVIDPAVYYGHREADLAMTKLFGGFPSGFYQVYHETYPLKEGAHDRENIYKLYHVMNHLNLFGRGYYGQALELMRYYLSST